MEYMLPPAPGGPTDVPAEPQDVVASPGQDAGALRARRLRLAGFVAAGVVATAVGIGVAQASGSSGATAAAASGPAGGLRGGAAQGPQGAVPPGGFAGGRGGVAGEDRVVGTLVSTTATSVTVKSQDGTTATYAVDASTDVRKNGSTVALSSLGQGEQVLVHVIPSSSGGRAYAERVLAGTLRPGGGGGFGPPDGGTPPDGTAPGGTTGGTGTGTSSTADTPTSTT